MDIAEQYLNAWNRHDPSALLNCFLPDGVYIDANLNHEVPALLFAKRAQELFSSFPNLQVTTQDRTIGDCGMIATRWQLSGVLPDRTLRGVDMLCVRDNKLQSVQVYFDYQTGLIFSKVPSLHLEYQPPRVVASECTDLQVEAAAQKYCTSGLTEDESIAMKARLERVMAEQSLFLQPDLSLSMLAEQLTTSTNHLSQVINSQFDCNFYEFVNRHRIAYTQRLIAQEPSKKGLALALDSGFRSTSTFYSAFKKETGLSPSEYRASLA